MQVYGPGRTSRRHALNDMVAHTFAAAGVLAVNPLPHNEAHQHSVIKVIVSS